jgi:hypothetical protein
LKLDTLLGLALREIITTVSYPTFLRLFRVSKRTKHDKHSPIGQPKKPLACARRS